MNRMLRNGVAVAAAAFVLSWAHATAQPVWLVSPEETEASARAPAPAFTPRSVPAREAPQIELLSPQLPGPVNTPTPIELRFNSPVGASIRPDTFKVLYGGFQIDITNRITKVASITDKGIQVPQAALPKGKHKLTLSIEDREARTGVRVVEFEIN